MHTVDATKIMLGPSRRRRRRLAIVRSKYRFDYNLPSDAAKAVHSNVDGHVRGCSFVVEWRQLRGGDAQHAKRISQGARDCFDPVHPLE